MGTLFSAFDPRSVGQDVSSRYPSLCGPCVWGIASQPRGPTGATRFTHHPSEGIIRVGGGWNTPGPWVYRAKY